MLKLFRRNRPSALPDGADPLKIRNLLDDPRLQAVMGASWAAEGATVTPLRRIEREERATRRLFVDRAA